jgi:hypothetical protein
VNVPVAVNVSTLRVANPLAAVLVSKLMPVATGVIVNTFVPTPKTVFNRSVVPFRCVVTSVVAVLVSNFTDGFTVIVSVCVAVSPVASVAVSDCVYTPVAAVGEITTTAAFAVVVSKVIPLRVGDIVMILFPSPFVAVYVSLLPPTPAPIASEVDVA